MFFFPPLTGRFGVKGVYMMGITAGVPCFCLFPIIGHLARNAIEYSGGLGIGVWVAIGLQVVMAVLVSMCYSASASDGLNHRRIQCSHLPNLGAVFVFIAAAAPNKASLGATNGLAQLSVSIVRAIGPALASSMYSLSIDEDHHYMHGGLVYYVTVALSLGAIWMGSLLPKRPFKDSN